jgi:hypothetical protein
MKVIWNKFVMDGTCSMHWQNRRECKVWAGKSEKRNVPPVTLKWKQIMIQTSTVNKQDSRGWSGFSRIMAMTILRSGKPGYKLCDFKKCEGFPWLANQLPASQNFVIIWCRFKNFLLMGRRQISTVEGVGDGGAGMRQCHSRTSNSSGRQPAAWSRFLTTKPIHRVALHCPLYWFMLHQIVFS